MRFNDPLSDVLTLLEARGLLSTSLTAGGAWGVHVQRHEGMKFNAVLRGSAWLAVDGDEKTVMQVHEGDCFVLTKGRAFSLGSDPGADAISAEALYADGVGQARIGSGDSFSVLGGRMTLDAQMSSLLLDALPAVIRVPAASTPATTLHWLLHKVVFELESGGSGSLALATQAMHMMFVEAIRYSGGEFPNGWIAALADVRLAPAIRAIHGEPYLPWTLERLAATSNLSRSVFSARFKERVGVSPLSYLTRWRLHLAHRDLRRPDVSIAEAAERAGYSSESAFGHAYKRVFGNSPRRNRAGVASV